MPNLVLAAATIGQCIQKKPAAVTSKPAANVEAAEAAPAESRYNIMFYIATNKIALRFAWGVRGQAFQFCRLGLSQALLTRIAKQAVQRIANGASEAEAHEWANAQLKK